MLLNPLHDGRAIIGKPCKAHRAHTGLRQTALLKLSNTVTPPSLHHVLVFSVS